MRTVVGTPLGCDSTKRSFAPRHAWVRMKVNAAAMENEQSTADQVTVERGPRRMNVRHGRLVKHQQRSRMCLSERVQMFPGVRALHSLRVNKHSAHQLENTCGCAAILWRLQFMFLGNESA